MRRTVLAAVLATALVPAAAHAESAADFNLFVLGDLNVASSDTQGRVAVGGDATVSNYEIGLFANPADVNLMVAGDLKATSGTLHGLQTVDGTTTATSWTIGGTAPGPVPIDFAGEAAKLEALSDSYAAMALNGQTTFDCGGSCVTFKSTTAGLNVFTISVGQIAGITSFKFQLDPGALAIVNVTGNGLAQFGWAGFSVNGTSIQESNNALVAGILWNVIDASTMRFNSGLAGSVLANETDYLGGWSAVNGQMVVKSFSDTYGSTQVNYVRPVGDLLKTGGVPEPTTWALMIAGFGLAGMGLRRRRAVAA